MPPETQRPQRVNSDAERLLRLRGIHVRTSPLARASRQNVRSTTTRGQPAIGIDPVPEPRGAATGVAGFSSTASRAKNRGSAGKSSRAFDIALFQRAYPGIGFGGGSGWNGRLQDILPDDMRRN
jgi:hypothetical protein